MNIRKKIMTTGLAAILSIAGCPFPAQPKGDCSTPADTSWLTNGEREVYKIDLEYNRGAVSLKDIELAEGNYFQSSIPIVEFNYSYALFNSEGRKVLHNGFDFPIVGISEEFPHLIVDPVTEKRIFVPRYSGPTTLEVYDNNCNIISSTNLD